MLKTSKEDVEALRSILTKNNFQEPTIKISVYKNRRGQYKDVLLWCKADQGICRVEPMFVTDYNYQLIDLPDIKINVMPDNSTNILNF